MTEIHAADAATATRFANWLYLAATPTFAVMALLTGLFAKPMGMPCSSGFGALLSGMLPMYVLMSAFHSAPWLKLIIGRGGAVSWHGTPFMNFRD